MMQPLIFDLFGLFAVVGSILIVATVIGTGLQRHYATVGGHPVIDNLNQRIKSWWLIVGLLSAIFVAGREVAAVAMAFCSFAALRELWTQCRTTSEDHLAGLIAFYVILPFQYLLVFFGFFPAFAIALPLAGAIALPSVVILSGRTPGYLTRFAEMNWAVIVAVYCLSYVPALAHLSLPGSEGRQILLVAFLIICAQSNDVAQYVFGKLFGRVPLAPEISPNKTIEGALGGIAITAVVAVAMSPIMPFSNFGSAALGVGIAAAGTLGGLVSSAIKRDRGIKDWGHAISGHGGYLDRLDSLIFSAPAFFLAVYFGWQ